MTMGILQVPGAVELQSRLLTYVRSGRIHPGLIFAGPDRSLKLRVARKLAQAMLCTNPSASEPFCGRCSACSRAERRLHPDLLIYGDDGDDSIKIDAIREMCREMEVGPAEAAVKIAILDEAQRMNAAAANAFLKTLEEPGEGRYFWLLTSQANSLLPTTRSRCVEFLFKPETIRPDESAERHRALLEEALRSLDPRPLVAAFDKDKERCLEFVRFLQTELRHGAVGDGQKNPRLARLPVAALVRCFDAAVELEGRLRSHASHGLMLELYLRRELFPRLAGPNSW